jgi:hypothetical protein
LWAAHGASSPSVARFGVRIGDGEPTTI